MRITVTRLLALGVCVLAMSTAGAEQTTTRKPFVDYWTAIRAGSVQVGCMHTTIEWGSFEGKSSLRAGERVWLRARNGTDNASIEAEHVVFASKDLSPALERIQMNATFSGSSPSKSLAPVTTAEFTYGPDYAVMVSVKDGKKTQKRIPLSGKQDYARYFGAGKISVGDEVQLPTLSLLGADPLGSPKLGFTLWNAFRAARQDYVTVDGTTYDAFVLTRQGSSMTMWVTSNCELLKAEDSQSGYTLLRQSAEDAIKWLESSGPDLGKIQVNRPIANSRALKDMKVRLVGLQDKSMVVSDNRQKATYRPEEQVAEYVIAARPFDESKSVELPVVTGGFNSWRRASKGIESRDELIQALAKQIVGDETNAYKAACKLRAWVHDNITYSIQAHGSKFSAVEILKTRKGVCTHFSVLYAALARAAGIPTKLVVGLCYGTWDGHGCFEFHTWAESYVGEWVAIEPTWGDEVVDATHVKMLEGGTEVVSDYYRAVGRLTAEVISPVLPPTTGRERVILAPSAVLVIRWPDGQLGWYCSQKNKPADPPTVTPGSIAITTIDTGQQLIVPPGYKMDSPDIPNLEYLRTTNPGAIAVVMPDGATLSFSLDANILETVE